MSQVIFPSLSAARCALCCSPFMEVGQPSSKHLEISQPSGLLYYWMSSGLTQEEAVPSVLNA